jgi:poly(hydroxyalkanoate) depolymerase family esterase
MKLKMNPAVMDAARLTRNGQLREAAELLQRSLHLELPTQANSGHLSNATDLFSRFSGMHSPLSAPLRGWRSEVTVADGAQFLAGSYSNAAGTRAYKLYVPSRYHGQTLPLLVMLHGGTQDPDDFAIGTRMNDLAEQESVFVVYPAQPLTANLAKCWNWFNSNDQERDRGEPSIIAGITESICESYAIDRERIFIAGMSAGGAMAVTMAINYPELYAAAGVHSGLPHAVARDLPSAMSLMQLGPCSPFGRRAQDRPNSKPIRAIVFHGDQDTTVHPQNGVGVVDQCTGLQPNAQAVIEKGREPDGTCFTRSIYLDAKGGTQAEHWLVHGAGHAWSGGNSRGSYTNPRGPDATKEMLRFFLKISR